MTGNVFHVSLDMIGKTIPVNYWHPSTLWPIVEPTRSTGGRFASHNFIWTRHRTHTTARCSAIQAIPSSVDPLLVSYHTFKLKRSVTLVVSRIDLSNLLVHRRHSRGAAGERSGEPFLR